jgi:hypothetical protein
MGQQQIYWTVLKQFKWLRQMTDPTVSSDGAPDIEKKIVTVK